MAKTRALDVEFCRRQFPPMSNGWAFFENAGGSYAARQVIERMSDYMNEVQVQPAGPFGPSQDAAERVAHAKGQMAAMINAELDEIIVGPSTTLNVYVLAQSLLPQLSPGDEIIVTNVDHEANNGAWRKFADHGIKVLEWRLNPDSCELEREALEMLLSERTRLVCFTQCSNVLGSIVAVEELTKLVHDAGAMVVIDAVAYAPHRRIDVKALDVDFYLFSLYKLYGPHVSILYGKRERIAGAAGQNHWFVNDIVPLKLNPGCGDHEATAALAGVVDYFELVYAHHYEAPENALGERLDRVFELFAQHEQAIAEPFVDFLLSKPDVTLYGRRTANKTKRVPTFAFTAKSAPSSEIAAGVADSQVGIRSGNFFARRLTDALGLDPNDGAVRASMLHYNTPEEVERLIRALDPLL